MTINIIVALQYQAKKREKVIVTVITIVITIVIVIVIVIIGRAISMGIRLAIVTVIVKRIVKTTPIYLDYKKGAGWTVIVRVTVTTKAITMVTTTSIVRAMMNTQ